jgi:hypothetical protein
LKDQDVALAALMLPEGILDFFELTSVGKDDEGLYIQSEEKNILPMEHRSRLFLLKDCIRRLA